MALTLTAEEQRLVDWAKDALPSWHAGDGVDLPELQVFAKIFYRLLLQIQFWVDMTYVGRAGDGAIDWLDALARELGTKRVAGESNDSLRYRLRNIQPAVTLPNIQAQVDALLDAAGLDPATIEELPRDAAFCTNNPGTPADAAEYGFVWTLAIDALAQRIANPFGGTIIVIVPFGTSTTIQQAVLALVRKLKAAGFAVVLEVEAA